MKYYELIEGNLLESNAKFIAHQTNSMELSAEASPRPSSPSSPTPTSPSTEGRHGWGRCPEMPS